MELTTLRIDRQAYRLAPEQDVDALKAQILDAAAGGARFVDLLVEGGGRVSVLVSPSVSAQFEHHDVVPVEPLPQDPDVWPFDHTLDYDLDAHYGGHEGDTGELRTVS